MSQPNEDFSGKGVALLFVCLVIAMIVLYFANHGLNILLGEGILSFVIGLGMLAIAAIPITLAIWPIGSILKFFLLLIPREKFQNAISNKFRFRWYFTLIFLALLVPHLWMSHKLSPLKKEFERRSNGNYKIVPSNEEVDGHPVNDANFGGSLSELVDARTTILIKYNFLPYSLGQWWYKPGYWCDFQMAYVYTYLPRDAYLEIAYTTYELLSGKELPDKERAEFEKALEKVRY